MKQHEDISRGTDAAIWIASLILSLLSVVLVG